MAGAVLGAAVKDRTGVVTTAAECFGVRPSPDEERSRTIEGQGDVRDEDAEEDESVVEEPEDPQTIGQIEHEVDFTVIAEIEGLAFERMDIQPPSQRRN